MNTQLANKIFNNMKNLNNEEQLLQLKQMNEDNFKLSSAFQNYPYLFEENKIFFNKKLVNINSYNAVFFSKAIKYDFDLIDHFDKYYSYDDLIKLKRKNYNWFCFTRNNLSEQYFKIVLNKINDNDIILNWFFNLLDQNNNNDIINCSLFSESLSCANAKKKSSYIILNYIINAFKKNNSLKILNFLDVKIVEQFYKQCLKYIKRNTINFYYVWNIFYLYLSESSKNEYLNIFINNSIKKSSVNELNKLNFDFLNEVEKNQIQSMLMYKKMEEQ